MKPTTAAEVQEAVQGQPKLLPRGSGSKPALSTPPADVPNLDMSALTGVLEYEPGEFTFTALAGTLISDVTALLNQNGQYLPFDPLLSQRKATLGGVTAADTSGSGRYRFGGVRDFLIGVRFVDGRGQLIRGGGKVVKNAAGFDLPKLMVGSLGRLGVLVELSFKVFPAPEAYVTLQVDYATPSHAVAAIQRLTTSHLEMDALDLEPPGRLLIRLGGIAAVLPGRIERLRDFLVKGPDNGIKEVEILENDAEQAFWQRINGLDWVPAGWGLVKVPLTLSRVLVLEERLDGRGCQQRYSVGGNVAWVAWPGSASDVEAANAETFFAALNSILARIDLAGLVVLGPPDQLFLGLRAGESFARRVKQALDPANRFLAY